MADTHSLLWYRSGDSRLGARARAVFEAAEDGEARILVPTIVLAEAGYIYEDLGAPARIGSLLEDLSAHPAYAIVAFDRHVLNRFVSEDRPREIHDRIIVATAKVHRCPVITRDRAIADCCDTEW